MRDLQPKGWIYKSQGSQCQARDKNEALPSLASQGAWTEAEALT